MKYLLLTGDDLGRSRRVNEEIECYHQAGALTQASLMVNEAGAEEAVRIARRNPELHVGLHLSLCDGSGARLSAITNNHGALSPSPAVAGLRYAFSAEGKAALHEEIDRQFSAFRAMGFPPTYWDGHHHLHLHPAVLRLTVPIATRYGFSATRLVREPWPWSPVPIVFRWLSRAAKPLLRDAGVAYVDRVYGLSRTGRIDARFVGRVLRRIPNGWSELYYHPGAEPNAPEPAALAEMIAESGVQLCNSSALLKSAGTASTPAHSPVSGGAD